MYTFHEKTTLDFIRIEKSPFSGIAMNQISLVYCKEPIQKTNFLTHMHTRDPLMKKLDSIFPKYIERPDFVDSCYFVIKLCLTRQQ